MSFSVEKICCVVCQSDQTDIKYTDVPDRFSPGKMYSLVLCQGCGFTYLSPRPLESDMAQFYDLDAYQPHNLSEESLFDRVYRWVRDKNNRNKRRLIEKYIQGGQVLDIGCATGEFLLEMKQHDWQINGMETAPEAREIALQQKISVSKTLDEISGSFDAITMWHVLEHVHRVDDLFKNIQRLLQPEGLLVFAIPNIDSLDARYYKNHWVALDTPRHLYHFRPQDIERLLENYGFELIRISPLLYFDPWYNALLSSQLKSAYRSRSKITAMLEAGTIGKLSFLNGLINPRRCASPVYVARSRK